MKSSREAEQSGLSQQPAGAQDLPEVGPCDDLHVRIAERAHELYVRRGSHDDQALDDWLQAERDILSQVPPA